MAILQVNPGQSPRSYDHNRIVFALTGLAGFESPITLADNVAGTLLLKPTTDPVGGTQVFQIQKADGTVQAGITAGGGFLATATASVNALQATTDSGVLGNLGIGTATPSTGLHISAAGQPQILMTETSGGVAGQHVGRLVYDSGAGVSGGGFVFQRITDTGAFSANLMAVVSASAFVGINTITPAFTLDVNGAAHASSFPTSSDARLKTVLGAISGSGALTALAAMQPVRFTWNQTYASVRASTAGTQIGLLAQSVASVCPELVSSWPASDGNAYLAMDYGRLTAVLVAAIQELTTRLRLLEAKVGV